LTNLKTVTGRVKNPAATLLELLYNRPKEWDVRRILQINPNSFSGNWRAVCHEIFDQKPLDWRGKGEV
jgi:hypothetical protein